jgi:hypothetical protein
MKRGRAADPMAFVVSALLLTFVALLAYRAV